MGFGTTIGLLLQGSGLLGCERSQLSMTSFNAVMLLPSLARKMTSHCFAKFLILEHTHDASTDVVCPYSTDSQYADILRIHIDIIYIHIYIYIYI